MLPLHHPLIRTCHKMIISSSEVTKSEETHSNLQVSGTEPRRVHLGNSSFQVFVRFPKKSQQETPSERLSRKAGHSLLPENSPYYKEKYEYLPI